VLQATRIRLYPTTSQQGSLAIQFGCARWAWNNALNETQRVYQETGRGLTFVALANRLPGLKTELEWLKDCDSQVLQASLRNLAAAFQNFFEKRGRYPKLKKKHNRQSIQYPQRVSIDGDRIRLPKVGMVKCVVHRPIVGTIKTVTVSRNPCGHFYAAVLTQDDRDMPPVSTDGKVLGVDVGLLDIAATSDGSKFGNPRHLRKAERNLKRKQQSLSRKKKGSSNRYKARRLVARAHERISNARRDNLHKLSRRLVDENQVIAVEDLNVKGMTKNHNLAKAIHDVGWSEFARQLEYKCERDGKGFIKVDRFFPSSKACSDCGAICDSMPLDIRSWTCVNCGSNHDRDINAAKNIRQEAIRTILAGGTPATATGGNVRRIPGRRPRNTRLPLKVEAPAFRPG
jgi:putative transposase